MKKLHALLRSLLLLYSQTPLFSNPLDTQHHLSTTQEWKKRQNQTLKASQQKRSTKYLWIGGAAITFATCIGYFVLRNEPQPLPPNNSPNLNNPKHPSPNNSTNLNKLKGLSLDNIFARNNDSRQRWNANNSKEDVDKLVEKALNDLESKNIDDRKKFILEGNELILKVLAASSGLNTKKADYLLHALIILSAPLDNRNMLYCGYYLAHLIHLLKRLKGNDEIFNAKLARESNQLLCNAVNDYSYDEDKNLIPYMFVLIRLGGADPDTKIILDGKHTSIKDMARESKLHFYKKDGLWDVEAVQ